MTKTKTFVRKKYLPTMVKTGLPFETVLAVILLFDVRGMSVNRKWGGKEVSVVAVVEVCLGWNCAVGQSGWKGEKKEEKRSVCVEKIDKKENAG